jgi:phytoene dehydrogenase-like protein
MTNQYQSKLSNAEVNEGKIVVIGGGLAGLTAATHFARAGMSVTVVERSTEAGGRARTSVVDGFYLNQGPHAIYTAGPGVKILKELGINYTGNKVTTRGFYALKNGKKYPMPGSLRQFLTTKLLKGLRSKIEAIRFFASLNKINSEHIQDISLEDWINKNIHNSDVKDLVKMFSRITTYANDVKTQSAGATIAQLQIAFAGGVIYLDGGWQTLVDGLTAAAQDAGVKILTGKKVSGIKNFDNDTSLPWLVHLSDGSTISSHALILAVGPKDAYDLLKNSNVVSPAFLSQIVKGANPVRAATLDLALTTLPNPDVLGTYGVDSPLYLSTHSSYARLAPNGGALIHVMKYLGSYLQSDPKADREELEKLMDMFQPGWRKVAVKERFLPNMIVSNALVDASQGGIYGRPDVKVPSTENLYIIGDWVGPEGLLADGSLSSAKRAAEKLLLERNRKARNQTGKEAQSAMNKTREQGQSMMNQMGEATLLMN